MRKKIIMLKFKPWNCFKAPVAGCENFKAPNKFFGFNNKPAQNIGKLFIVDNADNDDNVEMIMMMMNI